MANPTPLNISSADLTRILEFYARQNGLLDDQIEYQEEGNRLSLEYIKLLLEINKIKENALKTEETSHDIFKQMQNALRNYNKDLTTSKGIEDQIKKNKELNVKAIKEQTDLQNKLTQREKNEIADVKLNKTELLKLQKDLTEELNKSSIVGAGADIRDPERIKNLKKQIQEKKELIENQLVSLGLDARTLLFLKEQIEAMDALIAADKKSLEITKQKELKEKSIAALKRLTGLGEISLTTLLVNTFTKLDKAQTDYQRQTGRTVEYTKAIVATIDKGMISMSDYAKTANELTRQIGADAQAIFSPQALAETSLLTNAMGLATDEANNLAILSRTARVEMDKQDDAIIRSVANFNKQNKTAFTGAQIMKDVAKTSAATTVSLGSSAERIAKANLEARKLGVTLDQVDRTAESLLNFEQSISSELEAELLTGKSINLETARLYALNNDLEGVAKELGKNQELLNSYVNGNRIQQESIAKAMGMSREDMGKMIMNQKTQLGLSDEQVQKASGLSKEDFRRLTLQENINKSIEKMGEALAMPLEMLARMINFMNKYYGLWILVGAIGIGKSILQLTQMISITRALNAMKVSTLAIEKSITSTETQGAIASGMKSAFSSPAALITGGAVGLIMGALITAAIMSAVGKAKNGGDGIFPKIGRPMVVSKEGELFKGTLNDEIAMGPGIAKLATAKSSTTVIANNNAELKSEMREMISQARQSTEVLREILKTSPKEFALNLETTKFGTAINTTSYKTK